ncbi:Hypothetical protein, putative [Bodo saltans]|uniref:RRM domain-containing protein n=1 Tax=Bodo saltans TaxID=75058 RepID=A0A0S4JUP9_BODSA|nr:Hypothetical protein, putative [Bodo saltans]|eukprot:CUG93963.1 Hypothetical protein, putative [Bodo saltans]
MVASAPPPPETMSDHIDENRLVMRIENLSSSVTKEHILTLIESFAVVEKIIMPDPVMWMTVPIGRVEVVFASDNDAANVYAHLQGAMVDGAKMNISFVRVEKRIPEKRRRSPTPRKSRDVPRRRSSSERRYSSRRGRQSPQKKNRSPTPRKSRDVPRRRSSSERRYSSRRGRQSPPARRGRTSRSRSPSSRSSSGSPTWD